MTPEAQRIAIAKACGWTVQYEFPYNRGYPPNTPTKGVPCTPLPDYLNDLNAMHEAEKVLEGNEQPEFDYVHWLDKIVPESQHPDWALIHATAAQRAEAFLRTIGKWTE